MNHPNEKFRIITTDHCTNLFVADPTRNQTARVTAKAIFHYFILCDSKKNCIQTRIPIFAVIFLRNNVLFEASTNPEPFNGLLDG